MSALTSIADMLIVSIDVGYVPEADVAHHAASGFIFGGQLWVSVFRREAQA